MMSIYTCIDLVDEALQGRGQTNAVSFYSLGILKRPALLERDKQFLQQLKIDLQQVSHAIENDLEEQSSERLTNIISFLGNEQAKFPEIIPIIKKITEELMIIHQEWAPNQRVLNKVETELDGQYKSLLRSTLSVKPLQQGKMKALGNSHGECYGFTLSMVDTRLSPYQQDTEVVFNKTIYDYQKNQTNRQEDQQRIKRTRISRRYFCPSVSKQAERLYNVAAKRPGQDLSVHFLNDYGAHATYLSFQNDQKIRYADPNHGVFLFNNKEEFTAAYQLIYAYQNHGNPKNQFNFYQINKLEEDITGEKKESRTLLGLGRSLLTGAKYDRHTNIMITTALNSLVGSGAGGVVGAAIGSVVPIIGTTIGFVVGAVAGWFLGQGATLYAQKKGLPGMLGVFHLGRLFFNNFKEYIKEKLGIKRESDIVPKPMDFPCERLQQSTVKMMRDLGDKVNDPSMNDHSVTHAVSSSIDLSQENREIKKEEIVEKIDNTATSPPFNGPS